MNDLIYQLFAGRQENANIAHHKGAVLARMMEFDWESFFQTGFSYVYFLGLFDSRGPLIVEEENGMDIRERTDRLPSVFALSNHSGVHPDLGSEAELKALFHRVHTSGGKVLTDFVPNHTGLSHPWLTDHLDYYVQTDGNPIREFSGDVAKLNYENPRLCKAMTEVLLWIAALGSDGVRCDMAHLVPTLFWQQAITAVRKQYPDFIFIAEAYPTSLFDLTPLMDLLAAGFTSVYHEPLYRNLATGSLEAVSGHLSYFLSTLNHSQFVHYLSNHDDPVPEALTGSVEAVLALLLGLPGSVLIYNGLLNGFTRRLGHHYMDILPASVSELSTIPPQYLKLLSWRNRMNRRSV